MSKPEPLGLGWPQSGELVSGPAPASAGDVDVVVEIPRGTRNKYEYDEGVGRVRLDRQLPASVTYPADYGYIPGTLAPDGDPLDALVLLDEPSFPGCIARVVPLGMLQVVDQGRSDPKVVCVLVERWERQIVHELADLPATQLEEIQHFFNVYKDLEPNSDIEVGQFVGAGEAADEIVRARLRWSERG